MNRTEFVEILKTIKNYYPNYIMPETIEAVKDWFDALKDCDFGVVKENLINHVKTQRAFIQISDLRKGCNSEADWSVEWIKIVKGARAYELNEPARYAINVLTWDNVEYCIKENCSRTTQCMKEFERLYNDYAMKNMQRQLIGAELYDDIKQIPVKSELIEAHEEEELPPGAVVLPDGSVDYSEVERNWDW